MSAKHTYQVWAQSRAKGAHKLVLLALADHADHTGQAQVPLRTLAALCGLSQARAREIVDDLIETPELRVLRGGKGGGNANTYWITPTGGTPLCADQKSDEITPRKETAQKDGISVKANNFAQAIPCPATHAQPEPAPPRITTKADQAIGTDDVLAVLKAAKAKLPDDQPFFWTRREHKDDLAAILKRTGLSRHALCERIEKAVSAGNGLDFIPTRLTQIEPMLGGKGAR